MEPISYYIASLATILVAERVYEYIFKAKCKNIVISDCCSDIKIEEDNKHTK